MAEEKKKRRTFKPRPAKDVTEDSRRSRFLKQDGKPRAAKDVKPGSARERLAKGPTKKSGVSGTSTETRRFSDVKKSRGPFGQLTLRKENMPAKVEKPKRGIVKYEEPRRGVTQYKPAKVEAPKAGTPKGAGGGIGGTIARGVYRTVGGPAVMLVSMTQPAGEGSDKPTGPLMKGGKLPGYKYLDENRGGPKSRQGSSVPSMAKKGGPEKRQGSSSPSAASDADKKRKADEFRAKLQGQRPDGKAKAVVKPPAKSAAKATDKPKFKGNWVNAAPTEMQARGGARIRRPNLLDFLRKKK